MRVIFVISTRTIYGNGSESGINMTLENNIKFSAIISNTTGEMKFDSFYLKMNDAN